jgi:hypothetical protein
MIARLPKVTAAHSGRFSTDGRLAKAGRFFVSSASRVGSWPNLDYPDTHFVNMGHERE